MSTEHIQLQEKRTISPVPSVAPSHVSRHTPAQPKKSPGDRTKSSRAEDGEPPAGPKLGQNAAKTDCRCTFHSPRAGRNLAVCLDGTANQFGAKNSNVVELYSRLEKSDDQLTYYNSGIGTYAKPSFASLSHWKQVINHSIDMAIAWNFERIVLSAYQWLSENYRDGDRIFIFGFSRGAYQARVIAGMIEKVGLLHKGNNDQIAFAFELYAAATESSTRDHSGSGDGTTSLNPGSPSQIRKILGRIRKSFPSWTSLHKETNTPTAKELCDHFKRTLSRRDVKVHFVGAWDTVSSIGVAREPGLPETTSGMTHVCVFRHALALDELRVKFLPEYADGGAGPSGGGDVKEVWFAGSHSDIGGGNTPNLSMSQFGPALRWMTYEALKYGLKMDPYGGRWFKIEPMKSLTWVWKALEVLPLRRLSYKGKENSTRWPHLGRSRVVQPGQLIHQSVLDAIHPNRYVPEARIHPRFMENIDVVNATRSQTAKKFDWIENTLKDAGVIEEDPYSSAGTLLDVLKDSSTQLSELSFHALMGITASDVGLRSITESPGAFGTLMSALKAQYENSASPLDFDHKIINALIRALGAFHREQEDVQAYPYIKIHDMVRLAPSGDYQSLNNMRFRIGKGPFQGHRDWIRSVAFSPDGNFIVSASDDETIRVWDARTGQIAMKPFEGHTDFVRCAVFSPDGTRIASCSEDSSIRIWKVESGDLEVDPLRGNSSWVTSVQFSPDGSHILSCERGHIFRIWDARTGKSVMDGTENLIFSASFSPDGTSIVSGSYDEAIRVWDAHTGQKMIEVPKAHADWVTCVAFSPDGNRILSASADGKIGIWDARTGSGILLLEGHTRTVRSVVYSPDGAYIVSGSCDQTIRVWNANTGKEVRRMRTLENIFSIAISPYGSKIASSTERDVIQLWDLHTGELLLGEV